MRILGREPVMRWHCRREQPSCRKLTNLVVITRERDSYSCLRGGRSSAEGQVGLTLIWARADVLVGGVLRLSWVWGLKQSRTDFAKGISAEQQQSSENTIFQTRDALTVGESYVS
jgi:hypothetical protein